MGVITISSEQQYKDVVSSQEASAIQFLAPWDESSKAIAPKFKSFAERYPQLKFYKVDICDQQDVAMTAGVKLAPTFRFYSKGQLAKELKSDQYPELERCIGSFVKEL